MSTAPPTSPAPCRSASRPTRCATASPACSRAISPSPPPSFPRARAAASSTASPAVRCGKPGSTTPTARATASAASSRSTKARSAFRRSAARRAAATSRSRPGMIISNEPGYYKTGEYGIRIENLVLVVDARDRGRGKGDARVRDVDLRADRPPADRRRDARARGAGLAQLLPRPRAGEDRADASAAPTSTGCSRPARRSRVPHLRESDPLSNEEASLFP